MFAQAARPPAFRRRVFGRLRTPPSPFAVRTAFCVRSPTQCFHLFGRVVPALSIKKLKKAGLGPHQRYQ
nr:hypothetical protein Iba_chr15aCG4880 [Ipomoea batatas]